MSLQKDLVAYIKAINGMSERTAAVYWLDVPTGIKPPYITVQQVAGEIDVVHDGSSGLQMARVQVDCYGSTWAGAVALRDLVEKALKGYRGTIGSTVVDAIFPSNPMEFLESAVTPPEYRALEDFEIHFRKT
jgi:hypothetical protein